MFQTSDDDDEVCAAQEFYTKSAFMYSLRFSFGV